MPTDLLIEGADAYTSLAEIAAAHADSVAAVPTPISITWSICTLTIEGGC
ncbi:hypothetical protein GCM10009555_084300 [Acrocarpospora macrocephala]|uniref:Uncharacterized protein n=1 Tax=Acrocarpospora macrocephala TaxID=150177 RepID=A0A5M3WVT0_9ACTN|nr:LxmA leader domain family RiPP [Acrocarpospora macrocephala]GES13545.1 hypothetical protein Amac_071420 [Acrocarpospora macrocephala]